ncbi:MAG: hypothetical protein A3G34_08595 [Candidatus Lindowbacteria bacterium RIFCSPLOWO2_12_FULL_62_27]|nr:MAG: hypothetical protein A3G34_08595 [Candidatus Lindowbacteria bacterium RIFCSPLOWO2_12_FULL_62_27]
MVDPAEIRYESGQFIILHTVEQNGKTVKRSYSIASPPDPRRFSLCVKIVGPASRFIANLNLQDQVKFSGPWGMGKFTFPEMTENEIVLLASGTGLSPVMSILQSKLPLHPEKKFRFLWGLKREGDIYNRPELDGLAARHPCFSYQIVLSDAPPEWRGKRGMLSEVLPSEIDSPAGKEFFMAGNGAMIAAVETYLRAHGALPEKIHKEIFFCPPPD